MKKEGRKFGHPSPYYPRGVTCSESTLTIKKQKPTCPQESAQPIVLINFCKSFEWKKGDVYFVSVNPGQKAMKDEIGHFPFEE